MTATPSHLPLKPEQLKLLDSYVQKNATAETTAMIAYIKENFNITLSEDQTIALLNVLDFTYQKKANKYQWIKN